MMAMLNHHRSVLSPPSYRSSHIGRGWDYHHKFQQRPHRAMIWRLEQEFLDSVLDRWSAAPAECLDFACGTGRIVHHLAKRGAHVLGVDVSESMLAVARHSLPANAEVRCVDLTLNHAALGNRQFDIITAFRFFPNAEPELRDQAMAAIVRYLRPSGVVILNNHRNIGSTWFRLVRLLRGSQRHGMHTQEVISLLERHGLQLRQAHGLGILPLNDRFRLPCLQWLEQPERLLQHVSSLKYIAQNILFVAQKV